MPAELLFKYGTPKQIRFADHATDFDGTPGLGNDLVIGTPTDVQLDLTGVVDAAARESDKFDFGALRAEAYNIMAALEWTTGPTPPQTVGLYLCESPNSVAANGNPGGCVGVDGDYTGYSGGTLVDSLRQLYPIGAFIVEGQATTTIEMASCGTFFPKERYGSLVVLNGSGQALFTDAVEMHIVFNPVTPEGQ